MEYHPYSCAFPLMTEERLGELADDIRKHGLNNPLIIFEGKILDGRNRSAACLLAGVKPATEEFTGTHEEASALVWSENAQRRDLTSTQRAASYKKLEMACAEVAAAAEAKRAEARDRQKQGGKEKVCQTFDKPNAATDASKRTDAHRAKLAGTNRQYMHEVDKIAEAKPELLDDVASGKMTLGQAKREIDPTPRKGRANKKRPADVSANSRRAISAAIKALSLALEAAGILGEFNAELERIKQRIGS